MNPSILLAFAALRPELARRARLLSLRGLTLPVRIGVHDFERRGPQRLRIDVDVCVDLAQAHARQDRLDATFDYDAIRDAIRALAVERHFELQETLGDAILAWLMAQPGVLAARVRTEKPDVYPDCDAVGVERLAFAEP
ncbi:Dihydroneopterin aldolase [Tepidimonas alkaliphilus]|uniref:dihydroneopterin aldolase n=1 Tax=Tepidimonas alkaliphilus TaxID=2588942 RepID=A0A554W9A1_9BURK|nr:dihydroneopterin aldolase [Tepidimonas alkaliphilus]TSE20157.1 Dihydroneopterin aldolase [Tepidimonas alkaliphilus]